MMKTRAEIEQEIQQANLRLKCLTSLIEVLDKKEAEAKFQARMDELASEPLNIFEGIRAFGGYEKKTFKDPREALEWAKGSGGAWAVKIYFGSEDQGYLAHSDHDW